MIDLHTHILPGIDDGAANEADSLGMARQAEADGIDVVCATPHIRFDHDVRIGELRDRVADLNQAIAQDGLNVRVVTGGEVAEPIVAGLTVDELVAVSLGRTGRWILLEPGVGPLGEPFVKTVDRLARRGCRALIAHPERHFDQGSTAALEAATEKGALVQMTAAALAESAPGGVPVELARRGLVHVVASDSHSSRYGRPLRLSPGIDRLREIDETRSHVDWIAAVAPRAILRGDEVSPPFPVR